jgi:hypothetical protein
MPYLRQMSVDAEEIEPLNWGGRQVNCDLRHANRDSHQQAGIRGKAPGSCAALWRPSSTPVVERLYSLWVGNARRGAMSTDFISYFEDQRRLTRGDDMKWLLDTFERQLKLYLAEMARRRVFVHAGAVGWHGRR